MITKVVFHVGDLNLHFEEVFTDENDLTKECDKWLSEHNLNDGRTGFTEEEAMAVNLYFAERFHDHMNLSNYCEVRDIRDELWQAINDKMDTVVSDVDTVAIAKVLGVNFNIL